MSPLSILLIFIIIILAFGGTFLVSPWFLLFLVLLFLVFTGRL